MESTLITNANVISGFASLPDCAVLIEDGKIADVFNMKRLPSKKLPATTRNIDAKGCFLCPGLIDSHIHGFGGYGTEDMDPNSILKMSEKLADYGITSFLPTVYTDTVDNMLGAEKAIIQAMGHEKGATIRGINLEGPFISPDKIGGQNPLGVQPVDMDLFHRFIEAGEGKVVCMTVAPELKNMRELALDATKKGIVLLAGHTDARYENIVEGMQCGILHSTHFFNAMSRLHHRNPGTVGAIMIQSDMQCEIIADGVHVHPELIKLLLREKPSSNIVLITDSLKPNKQRKGPLFANGRPAKLSSAGAFVDIEDESVLLGSALVLIDAVKNMVRWGVPIEQVIDMSTKNPARIYHFNDIGTLTPGKNADIIVFDENFIVNTVLINGKIIKED
ncbi:MAG: N-acetylglucosamine-6-phosphate deacetylase [Sphaerochaetaceae bacterium]|jgi:N-acetylglucosamine-6-phosphate deacetylase|nr:N-acetylglucosamine-6-phosphate deacetylase [Sphaerochaetaceae bacterium]